MKAFESIFFNFSGGIISPGYLNAIMEVATLVQVTQVRFGNRQQLLMQVPVKHFEMFCKECTARKITWNTDAARQPNIVSSYAAAGIFINDTWLSEGVYKDIFDLFDYQPKLKINICDSDQTFVPFFNGHINWIASRQQHFWYLYLRIPKTNKLYRFPELVYTNDIVFVTKAVESLMIEKTAVFYEDVHDYGDFLYKLVTDTICPITKKMQQELELPIFRLPYYEGFNSQGGNYWLGIYRRNELFEVAFIKDICKICLETKIGELYATTWKSIIIKGIFPEQRRLWDYLLGKYRINVRHAANELNWIIDDDHEDGLILKRHIIRYFDKEDIRTYGLCFAVKTNTTSGIFGSVLVRKQHLKTSSKLKSAERFEILYTKDFNPNSSDYILYRDHVEKEYLGTYLVSLCKMYYEKIVLQKIPGANTVTVINLPEPVALLHDVYQCKDCRTVYIPAHGDPEQGITAGTNYNDLPATYKCFLCEAPKTDFEMVQDTSLMEHLL